MNSFFLWADSFLIWFFRIVDIPILGYYLGTAVVCLICAALGRFTLILGSRVNEEFLSRDHKNMVRMHNLSLWALLSKDKNAYRSCNKEANEAFGKVFFSQVALGASSLWPVPFALAWMQYRFGMVEFSLPLSLPGVGDSVGFMFTFFPISVLVYLMYARFWRWWSNLPFASSHASGPKFSDFGDEKLLSLHELTASPQSRA
jgi:hypothetical protein